MPKCKITVLKRTLHEDLVILYKTEETAQDFGPCTVVAEEQEFMVESPWAPPPGFCSWAWGDIRPYILTLCRGGEFPWSKPPGVMITCCTDGFRPVIFKIEMVDD